MGMEHIDDLRQQGQLRPQRYRSPAQGAGPARAIPMLVEMVDAVTNHLREPQHASDLGTTGAPRYDQILRDVASVQQDVATALTRLEKLRSRAVWLTTK